AANTARGEINKAETDTDAKVTAAKNAGITAVQEAAKKAKSNKAAAVEAITAEETTQKGNITNNAGLTSDEKASLTAAVTTAANTARGEINKAETDTDAKVTAAKNAGITAVQEAAKKAKSN
ncbi:DUF1542 domain-containing protein, partial [Klebsiella pneumoniae]|uniref:DUF1542 domain-containing protein n=1 Tax=Klebsiella pneumoniae TaxID=573 RepID=UPI001330EE84